MGKNGEKRRRRGGGGGGSKRNGRMKGMKMSGKKVGRMKRMEGRRMMMNGRMKRMKCGDRRMNGSTGGEGTCTRKKGKG